MRDLPEVALHVFREPRYLARALVRQVHDCEPRARLGVEEKQDQHPRGCALAINTEKSISYFFLQDAKKRVYLATNIDRFCR